VAWVVDTAVLIDVLEHDPEFGARSARALDARARDGLVLCPVSYVELSPAFEGDGTLQEEFLDGIGVNHREDWTSADTNAAHAAWNGYVQSRRRGLTGRRPIADVLIGAYASRFQGLITRNEKDFRKLFAKLSVRVP
jgi:predicted nucleic acid-binding protein